MAYETFSPSAPNNNTGSLTVGIAATVPNNPVHADSDDSQFPTKYDQFVNKTNANNNNTVLVSDEYRATTELFSTTGTYAGYLFLHHRPARGTSIGISNGTIVTGATDYTNGIVYFSSLPATDFNLTYFSVPDAYWGDHINAIQNAVMNIERVIGAGSSAGEGFKNASFLVHDYPASIQNLLPNATHVEALDRNLTIKGEAGSSRTITLGNGGDSAVFDVKSFIFKSSDVSYDTTGTFGESSSDKFYFPGLVAITSTGGLIGTGYGTGAVLTVGNPFASNSTGIAAAPAGYPLPSGSLPIMRVFGDIQIIGNIYTTGAIVATPTTTGASISLISNTLAVGQDLRVTGNTILGTSTTTTTEINGATSIGRSLHVKSLGLDMSRFDGPIDFRNPGNSNNGLGGSYSDDIVPQGTTHLPDLPLHLSSNLRGAPGVNSNLSVNKVTTIDGLDPSYIAKLLKYRGNDRHDFKHNMVNDGPRAGITGSVTSVSAPGTATWFDSGLCFQTGLGNFVAGVGYPNNGYSGQGYRAGRWFHLGGNYYHGKFNNETVTTASGEYADTYRFGNGNEWYVYWTKNDTNGYTNPGAWKYGAKVPLSSIDFLYDTGNYLPTGNATVNLSRSFNTAVQVGDTYKIVHKGHSRPNAIRYKTSTVINVYADGVEPIIANVNGIHKIITVDCDKSIISPYTGYNFLYVDLDTPEVAKQQLIAGSVLETNANIEHTTTPVESDSKILLGEFYSASPGSVRIVPDSIVTYAYNAEYDSLWFRTQNTGNQWNNNGSSPYSFYANAFTGTYTGFQFIESGNAFVQYREPKDTLVSSTGLYKTRVYHNFGSVKRFQDTSLTVYVAPNLGNDYSEHVLNSNFREGPDYSHIKILPETKAIAAGGSVYPCYEISHIHRNYVDLTFYNIAEIPGALIGDRTPANMRNYSLTGSFGNTSLNVPGFPTDRTRSWWWTRVVIK